MTPDTPMTDRDLDALQELADEWRFHALAASLPRLVREVRRLRGELDPDSLAQAIVDDLFTNGQGNRAERLVLMRDSDGRNLGGWCDTAVRDRIAAMIRSRTQPEQKEGRDG